MNIRMLLSILLTISLASLKLSFWYFFTAKALSHRFPQRFLPMAGEFSSYCIHQTVEILSKSESKRDQWWNGKKPSHVAMLDRHSSQIGFVWSSKFTALTNWTRLFSWEFKKSHTWLITYICRYCRTWEICCDVSGVNGYSTNPNVRHIQQAGLQPHSRSKVFWKVAT